MLQWPKCVGEQPDLDKNAVVNALDRAVSETVREEFEYLTNGKSASIGQWLRNNSRNDIFQTLRSLTPPNYSKPMVAVVYAAMYQLQHINMIYSAIKELLVSRNAEQDTITKSRRLQVVDFGAGCLATQFGMTLALADSLEQGNQITAVHVDSMDPNLTMCTLGEKIWLNFLRIVDEANSEPSSTLNSVHRACSMVTHRLHKNILSIDALDDSEKWICAIHAFYQVYEKQIRTDLSKLYQQLRPVAGLLTCYGDHSGNGHVPMVNRVSPFDANRFNFRLMGGQELHEQFSYNVHRCPQTTSINRSWGLIENLPATRRTSRAVLNWHYDTAFFEYTSKLPDQSVDTLDIGHNELRRTTEPVRQSSPNQVESRGIPSKPLETSNENREQSRQTPSGPHTESFTLGDRVRIEGVGAGTLRQIRKRKATVVLGNGLPCEVAISELRRL